MNLNIMKGLKAIGDTAYDHRSEILTGLGISGLFGMAVWGVSVTPTAVEMVNEKMCEEHVDALPKREVIKTVWKLYIPPLTLGMASAGMIIFAQVDCHRRTTALATAYSLAEKSLQEYKDAVKEVIPKQKQQEIHQAIARKQAETVHPDTDEIYETGKGNTLFKDPITGRKFRSSVDAVRKAENELNRRMRDEMFITLDDFYDELNLPHMGERVGSMLGWDIDGGYISMVLTPQMLSDDTVCIVIEHEVPPAYPT